jgi:hypothetical protein
MGEWVKESRNWSTPDDVNTEMEKMRWRTENLGKFIPVKKIKGEWVEIK